MRFRDGDAALGFARRMPAGRSIPLSVQVLHSGASTKDCRGEDEALPQCSAHGLRKAGVTIAADHGATEHQLMAIFGWESPKPAALCTGKANRRKLAGAGMAFLDLGDLEGAEEVDDPAAEEEN